MSLLRFLWEAVRETGTKLGELLRCPAVALEYGERYRCDERNGHLGQHRTDRGMYDVVWTDQTHTDGKG